MSPEKVNNNQNDPEPQLVEPGAVLSYQGEDVILGEAFYPPAMFRPFTSMQNLRAAAHGRHITMLAEAGLLNEYEEARRVMFDKDIKPLPMLDQDGDIAGVIFGTGTDEDTMVIARFNKGRFVGITFGGIANGQILPTLEMDFDNDGLSEVRVLDYRDKKLKPWSADDVWYVPMSRRPKEYRR